MRSLRGDYFVDAHRKGSRKIILITSPPVYQTDDGEDHHVRLSCVTYVHSFRKECRGSYHNFIVISITGLSVYVGVFWR